MQANINPFQFEGNNVRVLVDDHGEPLFVAKDAALALGYSDPTSAIKQHCKGVVIRHPLQTAGGMQEVRVIKEPDVYRLIFKSKLPSAEKFEKLVMEEILPSIRKTGQYSIQQRPMTHSEIVAANAMAIVEIERQQAEQALKLESQAQQLAQIQQEVSELPKTVEERPLGSESMSFIRKRINKTYGLSSSMVDKIIDNFAGFPEIYRMVKSSHESAGESSYAVYRQSYVTAYFKRFVAGCEMVTKTRATHPDIEGRFS